MKETNPNQSELKKQHDLHRDDDDINHNVNMKDNTINKDTTKDDKPLDCVKIAKRTYVFVALLIGFGILGLKAVSEDFDEWLDSKEDSIIRYLTDGSFWSWFWLIFLLILLTAMKSVSIKDVFGLRTIIVSLISWNITNESKAGSLFLAMFIMGILSSISKITEYRVIGSELQFIIGTPTKFIMKWMKIGMMKFCKINEEKLKFFDTKYTLEISYKSRTDPKMSIINNFQYRYGSGISADNPRTFRWYCFQAMVWLGAVLWTSCVEWVQPITELFLFSHNWRMSSSNVCIIVLAEFADFDKFYETWYIIYFGIAKNDIITAKEQSLPGKAYFWCLGYTIILFPTLLWAYKYHKEHVADDEVEEKPQEMDQSNSVQTDTNTNTNNSNVQLALR